MELEHYIRLLLRWWWLVVAATLLAGAAAYAASISSTPIYQASTTLLINQAPANSGQPDFNSLRASESLARTYVTLLEKRPVLDAVIAELALPMSASQLAGSLKASVVPETQLIVLTAEDTDPQRAAAIANAVVQVFSKQNRELQVSGYTASKQSLEQELESKLREINAAQAKLDTLASKNDAESTAQRLRLQALITDYTKSYAAALNLYENIRLAEMRATDNLYIVESAAAPERPARPRTQLNVLVAAFLGAVLAIGFVYLRAYLDTSVKSSEEAAGLTGLSALGSIGRLGGAELTQKVVTYSDSRAPLAEAYRILRANIAFASLDRVVCTLVVTSSLPREGKTVTAANLAVAVAQAGQRVILVDADLRRPSLHTLFQTPNEHGLTSALLHYDFGRIGDYLTPTSIDQLWLLSSGPLPPNPAELLGSQRMAELVNVLKAEADLVIFDCPPALALADTALLARWCDAAVLVVLASKTRADALLRTRDQILQSGTHLLGVVLNQARRESQPYSHYYSATSQHEGSAWSRLLGRWFRRARPAPAPDQALAPAVLDLTRPKMPPQIVTLDRLPAPQRGRRRGQAHGASQAVPSPEARVAAPDTQQ